MKKNNDRIEGLREGGGEVFCPALLEKRVSHHGQHIAHRETERAFEKQSRDERSARKSNLCATRRLAGRLQLPVVRSRKPRRPLLAWSPATRHAVSGQAP